MDPNLLPENLRDEEAKLMRKSHKFSNTWKTELHLPEAETESQHVAPDVLSEPGFWSKLLGKNTKKTSNNKSDIISLTEPKFDKPTEKGFNLLDSPIESLLDPIDETSGGWFKGVLGRAVSPIVSIPPKDKVNPIQPVSKPKNIQASFPISKKNETVKAGSIGASNQRGRQKAGDSWGSIFGGWFSWTNKKEDKLTFAKLESNSGPKIPAADNKFTEPVKPKKPEQRVEAPILLPKLEEKKSSKIKTVAEPSKKQKKIAKAKNDLPARDRSVEFGINLMPHDLQRANKLIKSSVILYFSLMLIASLVLLSVGYITVVVLNGSLQSELIQNKNQLAVITNDLASYSSRTTENNLFAAKVNAIEGLNQQKKTWSKFLPFLERFTLDGVYYGNLSADTSGVLVLPGVAENYDILAKQLAVLRDAKEFIKEAKISSAQAYTEGRAGIIGVSFQLRLVLQNGVFKATK